MILLLHTKESCPIQAFIIFANKYVCTNSLASQDLNDEIISPSEHDDSLIFGNDTRFREVLQYLFHTFDALGNITTQHAMSLIKWR